MSETQDVRARLDALSREVGDDPTPASVRAELRAQGWEPPPKVAPAPRKVLPKVYDPVAPLKRKVSELERQLVVSEREHQREVDRQKKSAYIEGRKDGAEDGKRRADKAVIDAEAKVKQAEEEAEQRTSKALAARQLQGQIDMAGDVVRRGKKAGLEKKTLKYLLGGGLDAASDRWHYVKETWDEPS